MADSKKLSFSTTTKSWAIFAKILGIGVDYKLGKKSKIFSYYSKVEADNGVSTNKNTFALGYEIKF